MMERAFKREEDISLIEEVLFNHEYDEDIDLFVRTGFSNVFYMLIVGLVALVLIIIS